MCGEDIQWWVLTYLAQAHERLLQQGNVDEARGWGARGCGGGGEHDQPLAQQRGSRGGHHGLLGLGLLNLNLLVLDGVVVELAHNLHSLLGLEGHKAEASMPLGHLVHQHHCVLHWTWKKDCHNLFGKKIAVIYISLTILTKIFLDLLWWGFLTDSTDKYFSGFGLSWFWLWCGWLGIYLLAVQDVGGESQHPVHGGGGREGDEAKSSTSLKIQQNINTRRIYSSHFSCPLKLR